MRSVPLHLFEAKGNSPAKQCPIFFRRSHTTALFVYASRRGAINAVQLSYLESYKPERVSKKKCSIM